MGELHRIALPGEVAFKKELDRVRVAEGDIADERAFVVQVTSEESGRPILGANCSLISGQNALHGHGVSNFNGEVEFLQSAEPTLLEVTSTGYVGKVLRVQGDPGLVQVELSEAQQLEGIFEDLWGAPSPKGVTVVAYDASNGVPRLEELRPGCFFRETEVHIATTNGAGRFLFESLELGRDYIFQALGPALASESVRVTIDRGREPIHLYGGRLRVVQLVLLDGVTRGRLSANRLITGRSVGVSPRFRPSPRARVARLGGSLLKLTGIADEFLRQRTLESSWGLAAFVGFSETGACVADVRAEMPGYQPESLQVRFVEPLGEVPTIEFFLEPLGGGLGGLEVMLRNPGLGQGVEGALRSSLASLRLVGTPFGSDSQTWFDVPIDLRMNWQDIEGIPAGEYQAYLRMRHGFDPVLPEQAGGGYLRIEEAEVQSVAFDLSHLHRAKFLLSDDLANQYEASFQGVILRHSGEGVEETSFYFPGPPYTFIGLPEGEYSLMVDPPVMFPRPADPASAGAKFRVGPETAGIVHDLEVVF